jgi:BolA protein
MNRVERIEQLLAGALSPIHLEIEDDSGRHKGHAGAAGGAGHFNVLIVATSFEGLTRIARHRAVHAALEALMPAEIHALSTRALTPAEWEQARR